MEQRIGCFGAAMLAAGFGLSSVMLSVVNEDGIRVIAAKSVVLLLPFVIAAVLTWRDALAHWDRICEMYERRAGGGREGP